MPRSRPAPKPRPSNVAAVLGVVATVAALYFAQDVLIPIALAIMFSFLFATPVGWLERHKVGRVPSVLIVVVIATALLATLGFVVGRQVYTLAESIDQYRDEIVKKSHALRGVGGGSGIGDRFASLSKELTAETNKSPATTQSAAALPKPGEPARIPPVDEAAAHQIAQDPVGAVAREATKTGQPATTQPSTQPIGATASNPLYVTTVEAPLSPLRLMSQYGSLILGPLGTAGLVIVFVIFVLLEREGLRDRLIRLVSRGKYTVTTKAINDAATRITRYVLAQSIVNGTYGMAIALGLWIIGLTMGNGQSFPSFVLWGLLCGVLRFIPYIGPWLAAAFPLTLSLAVYPGFHVFIAVVAMFVIIELLSNNFMEPWLYGTSTGLSTVAILVAAVFWTWLWGPIGLLLSTPLTVCIVVTGKYVGQLSFLDVLLSDEAALPPSVSYYQRLLAGDRVEATSLAREVLAAKGREYVPDEVLVPAVLLTRRDRANDDLTADTENEIFAATAQVIDETLRPAETKDKAPDQNASGAGEPDATSPAAAPKGARVLGCPAHHRAEELILQMLGRLLGPAAGRMEIASTRLLPSEMQERLCRDLPEVVFVAIVPPGGIPQARFLVRRLRKSSPDTPIVVGYFGKIRDFDRLLNRLRSAGATHVVTSVVQAYRHLQSSLGLIESVPGTSGAPMPQPQSPTRQSVETATELPDVEEQQERQAPRRDQPPEPNSTADGIASATPPAPTAGEVPVLQSTPKPN